MPKGRMLNKKISYDEKVAQISLKAKLLFTWCIPHLDIKGRFFGDPYIIKGTVVPYLKEFIPSVIINCLEEMEKSGLIIIYGNEHKYLQFNGFEKNQNLKENREARSIIPTPEQLLSNSDITPGEVKRSKVKRSKDILSGKKPDLEAPILYLNEKAGRHFDIKNIANRDLVEARYKEGRTLEQFKIVIDKKTADWNSKEDMMKYLRPETLFTRKHFESYLNEPKTMKEMEKEIGL